jgi:hypothetical protein
MFGLFGKRPKKPETAMDQVIRAIYGDNPPLKRANLAKAVHLAHEELLLTLVGEQDIQNVAADLHRGPVPYSTEDLAISTALNFFRRPDKVLTLKGAQLVARMKALEWLQEGKVAPLLVKTFEDSLYKIYKPV